MTGDIVRLQVPIKRRKRRAKRGYLTGALLTEWHERIEAICKARRSPSLDTPHKLGRF
jgi:hypothetical protein